MEIKIIEHTCAMHGCGISFWTSDKFDDRRRADHRGFYCPNGHSLAYQGETDAQKLVRIKREKDAEIERLQKEIAACAKRKRGRPRKTS